MVADTHPFQVGSGVVGSIPVEVRALQSPGVLTVAQAFSVRRCRNCPFLQCDVTAVDVADVVRAASIESPNTLALADGNPVFGGGVAVLFVSSVDY